MSVELLNKAFKSNVKPSSRKFVLVALCDYANEVGEAYPSVSRLSEKTSQDRKTVLAHLKALAAAGFIVDTGERKGRTKQVVVWSVRIPESVLFKSSKLNEKTVPKTEQFQKRNSSESGTGKSTENGTLKGGKGSQKRDTEPPVSNPKGEPPASGMDADHISGWVRENPSVNPYECEWIDNCAHIQFEMHEDFEPYITQRIRATLLSKGITVDDIEERLDEYIPLMMIKGSKRNHKIWSDSFATTLITFRHKSGGKNANSSGIGSGSNTRGGKFDAGSDLVAELADHFNQDEAF